MNASKSDSAQKLPLPHLMLHIDRPLSDALQAKTSQPNVEVMRRIVTIATGLVNGIYYHDKSGT
jgi:hypothetical protein